VAQIDAEIIGALLGAIVGAVAGALVSRWSIRYDRQIAACSAMQALADEARFNAHVVRHAREDVADYSPSALERQAFDAALPVLYVLPPELRDRSHDARSKILIMMHLEEIIETSLTKPDPPPPAIIQKRQGLIEILPEELDGLAGDIAMFVKTDCESRWFGSRSASSD
jgi:type II secretory pathway pseudopilin PulG